jgi:hypothetical protein
MTTISEQSRQECFGILQEWLESCTRKGKISRNTIAVGIVVLDHLRQKCPLSREEVISEGGEIKGSRVGLGNTLEKFNVSPRYLKEVTTRQAPQDGQRLFESFEWGEILADLSPDGRDELLVELIDELAEKARAWLRRRSLKLDLDRAHSPSAWIHLILEGAKGRSGGVLEQHLVGAKLEKRFKGVSIPNYPAHAADVQTERPGDFAIQDIVYHVTATPGRNVIQKCAANLERNQHPILLVPRDRVLGATALAEDEGVGAKISIISIEDFLACNIIELATVEQVNFFQMLQDILEIYNRRLAEVETDLSLQIKVR